MNLYTKNQLFGTIIIVAGLSSFITYLMLRSKEAKSKAAQTPTKKTDLTSAVEIVNQIKLLDSNAELYDKDNGVTRDKERAVLLEKLNKLGYDLKFKSYQRVCNSEPCETKYVLVQNEPTSSAAGQPHQRWFESWEHYKSRLMKWYRENN